MDAQRVVKIPAQTRRPGPLEAVLLRCMCRNMNRTSRTRTGVNIHKIETLLASASPGLPVPPERERRRPDDRYDTDRDRDGDQRVYRPETNIVVGVDTQGEGRRAGRGDGRIRARDRPLPGIDGGHGNVRWTTTGRGSAGESVELVWLVLSGHYNSLSPL